MIETFFQKNWHWEPATTATSLLPWSITHVIKKNPAKKITYWKLSFSDMTNHKKIPTRFLSTILLILIDQVKWNIQTICCFFLFRTFILSAKEGRECWQVSDYANCFYSNLFIIYYIHLGKGRFKKNFLESLNGLWFEFWLGPQSTPHPQPNQFIQYNVMTDSCCFRDFFVTQNV